MFSLIGAFYYLRVVKMAYFDEPEGEPMPIDNGIITGGVMSVNGLLIIVLGVLPGGLMALCVSVIEGSLKF
jgi:NADH-quinone oxidoreductase subunit N